MEEKIKGGYILLSRNIIESQIWQKPPEYLKIWIYILSRVNWKKSKNNDIGEDLFNFRQEKIPGVKLRGFFCQKPNRMIGKRDGKKFGRPFVKITNTNVFVERTK